MVFKMKDPELSEFQTRILKILSDTPKTAPEICRATHDPYSRERAELLVSKGLAIRMTVRKVLPNGKVSKKSRPAWAITERGTKWLAELVALDMARAAVEDLTQ